MQRALTKNTLLNGRARAELEEYRMPRLKREVVMARCAGEALLAAIEIYNKPTVAYREQTFALLIVNAWEILVKARLVQKTGKLDVIYEGDSPRAGAEAGRTISLRKALGLVDMSGAVKDNITGLITIRNESVHLGSIDPKVKNQVLAYGTASVQNFIKLSSTWFGQVVQAPYLLPVGFVGEADLTKETYPKRQRDLLTFLEALSTNSPEDPEFAVIMKITVNLNRGLSAGGHIGITNDPSAPKVRMTDDELLGKYPASYGEVIVACKKRYHQFKQDRQFHAVMKTVKKDVHCAYERRLNPKAPKSSRTFLYDLDATLAKLDGMDIWQRRTN